MKNPAAIWLLSTAVLTMAVTILDRPRKLKGDQHNWQGTTFLDVMCYFIFSAAITGFIWLIAFWK